MPIRVLLVDDHNLIRKGISLLLRGSPDLNVVGEAADGQTALEFVERLTPDVVVMDLGLPDLDGAEVIKQVAERWPQVRMLVLSAFMDQRRVVAAMRAGACGYVPKDVAADELFGAIRTVAEGKLHLNPDLADAVLRERLVGNGGASSSRLTPREREILQMLADGKAMKQVAGTLHISTKTVESHRRAVMEKLGLFSMAELTKYAVREGLATLD